eukprot:TRINITY_DN21760_c0_g1_i1.p1 TRINITY_DN21760_c0_g1~~TRINITY_DN21760_c0_g1_i1.p1  ORF type:complete len:235 (+),score=25.87 TRINITY_DN21760_c0_g1_i1:59-763(+)
MGYLILRDVPKQSLTVNGIELEIVGGFRGLKGVPPGLHKYSLAERDGSIDFEAEVPEGDAVVLRYDFPNRKMVVDDENGARFRGMALGGAMDHVLLDFPPEAVDAGDTTGGDSDEEDSSNRRKITSQDEICYFVKDHMRLNACLTLHYKIQLTDLESMTVVRGPPAVELRFRVVDKKNSIRFVLPHERLDMGSFAPVDRSTMVPDDTQWSKLESMCMDPAITSILITAVDDFLN